jgi:hypothetical protein
MGTLGSNFSWPHSKIFSNNQNLQMEIYCDQVFNFLFYLTLHKWVPSLYENAKVQIFLLLIILDYFPLNFE